MLCIGYAEGRSGGGKPTMEAVLGAQGGGIQFRSLASSKETQPAIAREKWHKARRKKMRSSLETPYHRSYENRGKSQGWRIKIAASGRARGAAKGRQRFSSAW